jgi:hypothetical protein
VSGTWGHVAAAYLGAGALYAAYLAHLLHQRGRLADQLVDEVAVNREVEHELAIVGRIELTDLRHRRGSVPGAPSSASASAAAAAASARPSPPSASDGPEGG